MLNSKTTVIYIVLLLTSVPGVPQDIVVQLINSTAVLVTWSPPSMANGIIVDYELCHDLKDEKVCIKHVVKSQFLMMINFV